MRVLLLIVAICCVAAVQATSSEIKSIKKAKPDDNDDRENDSDGIKVSSEEKNDQQENKDVKDNKTESNESDCVSVEIKSERKEREDKRKEKEREDKRKEKERKDKGDKDKRNACKRKKDRHPSEPKCILICLLIADLSDPICAEPDGFEGDSKTFDNQCQLNTYNCRNPKAKYKKTSDGPCEPICPQDCPFYVKPFCALADGWCAEPQTFANPCYLAVHNCENPNNQYTYFHDGECLTTPAPVPECGLLDCPQEEEPICALPANGFSAEPRTFYNKCYLEVYNCFNPNDQYEYFHDSKCLNETTTSSCDKIVCTKEYFPFCAIADGFCGDIRIFSNECMMDLFNCNNPSTKYKYFHDGECLTTPAPEPNCAAISCSNEGPSICGLPDGFCGPPQTFTNECNLEVHNCFNPDAKYQKFHDGNCIEPVTACTEEYVPVCATSPTLGSKTFSNKCEQDAYISQHPEEGYTPAYDGECKPEPICKLGCPRIYRPVCGIDCNGKEQTFNNQCEFEASNCLNPNEQHTLAYEAQCNNCKVACFDIYAPVCSLNTLGVERQWPNQCELDSYNCQHPNDQHLVSYQGECHACTVACKDICQPVCSVDSSGTEKTWPNQCELDSHNCRYPNDLYTLSYEGECNNCKVGCPKNYAPICTLNSSRKERQWSNQCELDSHNCRYPKDQHSVAYDGECHECTVACIQLYDPVCCADGAGNEKVWGNQCELSSHNCRYPYNAYTVLYKGECKAKGVKVCPKIISPLCAKGKKGHTKTFNNECEMDNYNCEHPDEGYTKSYDGKCKS